MKENDNVFNELKATLLVFARIAGYQRTELLNPWNSQTEELDWSLDYKSDWQHGFSFNLDSIFRSQREIERLLAEGDENAALVELAVLRGWAMNLEHLFAGLREDIEKIVVKSRNAE